MPSIFDRTTRPNSACRLIPAAKARVATIETIEVLLRKTGLDHVLHFEHSTIISTELGIARAELRQLLAQERLSSDGFAFPYGLNPFVRAAGGQDREEQPQSEADAAGSSAAGQADHG